MLRREFIRRSVQAAGAAWLSTSAAANARWLSSEPLPTRYNAHDEVVIGKTGIRTSRLAMGTGTIGFGHASNQTRIGQAACVSMLLNGYHENGLRFFDTADGYGSHPEVAAAIRQLPREQVTVMTKSDNCTVAGMRADIERFRRELGVDTIDILLIHCVTEADWTTRYRPIMDVLSEAKEKGIIRAHGCSCHTIQALHAAAASPWVDVDLVRLNPIGKYMDAHPDTVIPVIQQMRAQGKGIVGMKILGQGSMSDRPGEAVRFALGTGVLDAFTIGAESIQQQDELVHLIRAA